MCVRVCKVIPTNEAFNVVLSNMPAGVDLFLAYKFLRDSELAVFHSNRITLTTSSCEELGMSNYLSLNDTSNCLIGGSIP